MPPTLEDALRRRIGAQGPVPYARFMEWALYDPILGYYTAGPGAIGSDAGDFTTAPHLSPLFAHCLARLVAAADRALGQPDPLVVFEGGPGEGRLARDLLDRLQERFPDLYRRLRLVAEERSPALARRQDALWAAHVPRIGRVPPEQPVAGLYLSNELVDAFPAHRLLWEESELREVWVAWGPAGLEERHGPASSERLAQMARERFSWVPPAHQFEINMQAGPWLRRAAARLERGYLVTLDYGDRRERLFGAGRPLGTCVAYRSHRQSADLLAHPGAQDLTAQVDFSTLLEAGAAAGLDSAPLFNQREFLFALGILEELEARERDLDSDTDQLALRRSIQPLLFPGDGLGDAFKALVQSRNAPLDELPLVGPG